MRTRGSVEVNESDSLPLTRTLKPSQELYTRAQQLYQRYFSAAREFFCSVVSACVGPRVKGLVYGNMTAY